MDFMILKAKGWAIEHSPACLVPGYLIVSPLSPVRTLGDLPGTAQRELAPVLHAASEAIQLTIAPVRVHCARFGEDPARLRFHLFPRSRALTQAFLGAFPGRRDLLLRPALLHWARCQYRAPVAEVWRAVAPVIPALREAFLLAARSGSPLP